MRGNKCTNSYSNEVDCGTNFFEQINGASFVFSRFTLNTILYLSVPARTKEAHAQLIYKAMDETMAVISLGAFITSQFETQRKGKKASRVTGGAASLWKP